MQALRKLRKNECLDSNNLSVNNLCIIVVNRYMITFNNALFLVFFSLNVMFFLIVCTNT